MTHTCVKTVISAPPHAGDVNRTTLTDTEWWRSESDSSIYSVTARRTDNRRHGWVLFKNQPNDTTQVIEGIDELPKISALVSWPQNLGTF